MTEKTFNRQVFDFIAENILDSLYDSRSAEEGICELVRIYKSFQRGDMRPLWEDLVERISSVDSFTSILPHPRTKPNPATSLGKATIALRKKNKKEIARMRRLMKYLEQIQPASPSE